MELDVHARDFVLTGGIRTAIAAAAARYASLFRSSVRKVAVRVYDLNGPRGGPDKGCLVVAEIGDGRTIVSSEVDADLYRAIPRAFDKLTRGTKAARRRSRAHRAPSAQARCGIRGLVMLVPPSTPATS